MIEVNFVEVCDAPIEVAFEYLDNYRHVTEYMHGVISYEPVGELERGLGSTFDAVTKMGPTTIKSRVRNIHWEPNTLLKYESVEGTKTTTTYRFAAISDTQTEVEFALTVEMLSGVAGRAVEKTVGPLIESAGKHTAQNMARRIAEYNAGPRPTHIG